MDRRKLILAVAAGIAAFAPFVGSLFVVGLLWQIQYLNDQQLWIAAQLAFLFGGLLGLIAGGICWRLASFPVDKLIENEMLSRSVVEELPDLLVRLKPDGTVLFASQTYCDYLGLPAEKVIGTNLYDIAPHYEKARLEEFIRTISERRISEEPYERRCLFPDGREAWFNWIDTRRDGKEGHVWQSSARDVTARRSNAGPVQDGQSVTLVRMLEASTDGMVQMSAIRDNQGQVIDFQINIVNTAATKILRASAETMRGGRLLKLFPGHIDSGIFAMYREVCDTGQPKSMTLHYHAEGLNGWSRITAVAVGDGVACAFKDISREENSRIKMEQAQALAQQLGRSQSTLVLRLCQDMKGRAESIGRMLQEADDPSLSEDARDLAAFIGAAGTKLLARIDELTEAATAASGRLKVEMQTFDLLQKIDIYAKRYAERAAQKNLGFAWRISENVPQQAIGDPTLFSRAIKRLLDNAIRFTEKGEISLTVDLADRKSDELDHFGLRIRVTDSGCGIDPWRQPHLFELMPPDEPDSNGNLGLSMVKAIALALNGEVSVESKIDEGSKFRLVVQLGWTEADRQKQAALPEIAPEIYQILVADDDEINRQVACRMLAQRGHQVVTCVNGQEAVELAERQPFDVILMDVSMPVMDGLEATRTIRAMTKLPKSCRIIALTANVLPEHLEQYVEAGMDSYLAKPFTRDDLLRAVEGK